MDRLSGLTAFVRTADLGSFAAAGRVLGLSASAVGKAVTNLERQLGVRLLQRSTRSIRLTEEDASSTSAAGAFLMISTTLRRHSPKQSPCCAGGCASACPLLSYHLLLPVLPEFVTRYPDVELDIDFKRPHRRYDRRGRRCGDPQRRPAGFTADVALAAAVPDAAVRRTELSRTLWRSRLSARPRRSLGHPLPLPPTAARSRTGL